MTIRLPKYNGSSWIRDLTVDELSIIREGFNCPDEFFMEHNTYGYSTLGINPGKTVWLHLRRPDQDWENLHAPGILNITKLLTSLNLGVGFGRSYIHRLYPGTDVLPHVDDNDWNYFQLINRHHIYLDIPAQVDITIGNEIRPNSLSLFRHDLLHAYKNNGDRPFTFLVFDCFRETGHEKYLTKPESN